MSDALPTVVPVPLSEPAVRAALFDAAGDLFVAAAMLGHVTIRRLDQFIRGIPELTAYYVEVKKNAAVPEYEKLTQRQIEDDIARRLSIYRSDGLDALHDLATMPVSENSAQNQVKLLAAAKLAGPVEGGPAGTDIDTMLRQLNDDYHRAAPRIKVIRERLVEFHDDARNDSPGTGEPPSRDSLPPPN